MGTTTETERLHIYKIQEKDQLRLFIRDKKTDAEARLSFAIRQSFCHAGFSIGCDEDPLQFKIAVPYVLSAWLTLDHPLIRSVTTWIGERFPGDINGKYAQRDFSVSVHNWALWWDVGADQGGWTSKRPKWMDGSWHFFGHRSRQTEEVIKTEPVEIPMPERTYKGVATLSKVTWGFEKLPRMFDQELLSVEIKMDEGEAIPHPGKGENSWDCGEDATYSSSGPARSIEEAIGSLVGSTLRARRRHGGRSWRPAPKAPPPAPAGVPTPAATTL